MAKMETVLQGIAQEGMIDLNTLGEVMRQWQDHNFGSDKVRSALQLCEESGEVARAVGKEHDGIRPNTRGKVSDELADVLLSVTALGSRYGINLHAAVEARMRRALAMDFVAYPEEGRPPDR